MIANKKGVSAIVITVVLVALVLVATGIVWGVVRNLIGTGAESIEVSAKCIHTELKATAVDCTNPAACSVTITRTGTNSDEIGGVKLVFKNDTANSGVIDEPGNVEILVGKTITADSTLTNPNKVEVTGYFMDEGGKEQLCTQTTPFNF